MTVAACTKSGVESHRQEANCRYVRGTIIESEEKVDDIDYSVRCKRAAVFWIYISNNIEVSTLYLSDFPSILLAQCRL